MNIDLAGWGEFLVGIAALSAVISSAIFSYRTEQRSRERAEADERRSRVIESKVDEVHHTTNGLTKELQSLARAAGFAAGQKAAEREAELKEKT